MAAINKKHLADVPAKISVAPFASGIPVLTPGTNDDVVHSYITANFTFTRVASVIDLTLSESISDNLIEVEADECDTGTILKKTRPTINVSATRYESLNPQAREILLGLTSLNVAGTPVAGQIDTKTSGSRSFGTGFLLSNANGDGTAVTVNSVTGSVDGALALNVDYAIGLDGSGNTVITILDSATVTTEAQDLTIDYDYTPNASVYQSIISEESDVPSLLVKIETCPDENGLVDTYYVVDSTLDGELATPFLDVTRAGDLTGSDITFVTNKSWYVVKKLDSVV